MWDRFSPAEMERRWGLARELMEAHEVDALLLFGNSGMNRHNEANVFWLSNHLDLHHCYLVAPRDESIEAALYTGLTNHVPNAKQVSEIPFIEWGGYDPAETVAARIRWIGLEQARIGLVGINSTFAMGMPYQHERTLRRLLPELFLVELTREFAALRTIKSKEEIDWLRKAAALTDRTIETLKNEVRPGIPEHALLGIIEHAYRSDGGLPHIAFLRSMPMDSPNGCLPAQNPSDRKIREGDVIITEISASYWGYSGQIHRPIFVGCDPTPEWQALFDTALAAYDRVASALVPGAYEADAIRAASVIGERGYAIYDDLIHGYGVDIAPPLIDRSCVRYWPWDENNPPPRGRRFDRNMTIVIQPNPITPDERMGLQLGALTVITENGAESLHKVPFEPVVTGL